MDWQINIYFLELLPSRFMGPYLVWFLLFCSLFIFLFLERIALSKNKISEKCNALGFFILFLKLDIGGRYK